MAIVKIGFDSEYVPGETKNDIVSYQAYAKCGEEEWEYFRPLKEGERLTLSQLLTEILQQARAQGKFTRWPKTVHLAMHWSLADLTSLKDFSSYKTEFDGLKGTFVTLKQHADTVIYDSHRNAHKLKVRLFDTKLLAPEGKRKLEDLGTLLGFPKGDVADEDKRNMRAFYERDPEAFRRYGIQDAKIAIRWLEKIEELSSEILDEHFLPSTVSQLAVRYTFKVWEEEGIDQDSVLGQEEIEQPDWRGTLRLVKVPLAACHVYALMATEAFHGGRNEAFYFGATEPKDWYDHDLTSAYATALATLGMPRWDEMRRPTSLAEFDHTVVGAAYVEFSFPEDVRYPCLPVREMNNVIFPLQGKSHATAPEIATALRMGARMQILNDAAYLIPMDFSQRPFLTVARNLLEKRREAKAQGHNILDLIYKLIGNGIYGKLAQGLKKKRCFDTRSGKMRTMPPSKISNVFLAAAVTGFIRAVIAELLWKGGGDFISVTTDGFITDQPLEALLGQVAGLNLNAYAEARSMLSDDGASHLVTKHRVKQVLCWRTRGQATLECAPGVAPLLAKAGIWTEERAKEAQNNAIVEKFINREHADKSEVRRFVTQRDIYFHDVDLGQKKTAVAYRMCYDFKRTPHPTMRGERRIREKSHVWFDTLPLPSADTFKLYRDGWEHYTKSRKCVLRTLETLEDFELQLGFVFGESSFKHSYGPGGAEKTMRRVFLNAYFSCELGLEGSLSNKVLAERLSRASFPTQVSDVENARRKPKSICAIRLRRMPKIIEMVKRMKEEFLEFDGEDLYVPGVDPLQYDHALHLRLPPTATNVIPFEHVA